MRAWLMSKNKDTYKIKGTKNYLKPEHLVHMEEISQGFTKLLVPKYTKGVGEHGGHIKELSKEELIDNAIEEAVDQVVYLLTLKEKITKE